MFCLNIEEIPVLEISLPNSRAAGTVDLGQIAYLCRNPLGSL